MSCNSRRHHTAIVTLRRSPFNSFFDVGQMSDLIPSNDSNAGESISDPYALQAGDLEYYKNNFGYIVPIRLLVMIPRTEITTATLHL